jgi:hypothetical protein
LLTSGWQQVSARLINALIARQTPNTEKIAVAYLLVDLACLGIKSALVRHPIRSLPLCAAQLEMEISTTCFELPATPPAILTIQNFSPLYRTPTVHSLSLYQSQEEKLRKIWPRSKK